ncbi:hypothetical protein QVD17_38523 [Tagetes erecta]|uniref:Uncharacterized protein n=1 Tax=Tagetes erecta TaxID=13708 RepID=A0AAD8JM20_TARER|nr:hypothetical protein QVD17_38523 [Tagetes erecta]
MILVAYIIYIWRNCIHTHNYPSFIRGEYLERSCVDCFLTFNFKKEKKCLLQFTFFFYLFYCFFIFHVVDI